MTDSQREAVARVVYAIAQDGHFLGGNVNVTMWADEIIAAYEAATGPRPDYCPCENEQPDPCPACGATVATGSCQARYRGSSPYTPPQGPADV
jgi:hypothetical protein